MKNNPELIVNKEQSQFEFHIGNYIAFIEFSIEGSKIYLTHTEVPTEIKGQGIGTALVKASLHYIKENNLTLIPMCSFVANYVNNHDEWQSILSEGYQM